MVIISGPSTVGKNPFIYRVCDLLPYHFIVPYTTRERRTDEVDGKDYSFLTVDDFQSKIKNGVFSDWDYCLGNYYGYEFRFPGKSSDITHGLSRMALRIKSRHPKDVILVFLMPYSIDHVFSVLENIYQGENLILRKQLVEEECRHSRMFDFIFTADKSTHNPINNTELMNLLKHEIMI